MEIKVKDTAGEVTFTVEAAFDTVAFRPNINRVVRLSKAEALVLAKALEETARGISH